MNLGDSMRGFHDLIILKLLSEEDSYGYEISKKITQGSLGDYTIKETTLYSAFNRLEKQEYIFSYEGKYTHGRIRTYYGLTVKGGAYLKQKRLEWDTIKSIMENILEETR